jgi:hypothetical protein
MPNMLFFTAHEHRCPLVPILNCVLSFSPVRISFFQGPQILVPDPSLMRGWRDTTNYGRIWPWPLPSASASCPSVSSLGWQCRCPTAGLGGLTSSTFKVCASARVRGRSVNQPWPDPDSTAHPPPPTHRWVAFDDNTLEAHQSPLQLSTSCQWLKDHSRSPSIRTAFHSAPRPSYISVRVSHHCRQSVQPRLKSTTEQTVHPVATHGRVLLV